MKFDDIKKYYLFRALLKRFVLPILVIFAVDRGLSVEQIAGIATLGYIASFIMEIPSGAIADSIGHKRALVLSMLGQAVGMSLYLGGSFWWILAATVTYFVAGSLMTGTAEAMFYERIKELGREDEHQKLSGKGRGFAHFVGIFVLAFTGLLYTYAWWAPFVIGIAQFLLAAIVINSFQESKRHISVEEHEGFAKLIVHFKESWISIKRTPLLKWMIIIDGAYMGLVFATADFQQIALENVGLAVAYLGLFYSAKRIVAATVAPYVYLISKHFTAAEFILLSGILVAVSLLLAAITSSQVLLAAVFLIPTLVYSFNNATNHYLNQLITTGSRATTLSFANLLETSAQVTTGVAIGLLGRYFEMSAVFGLLGASLAVFLVLTGPFLLRANQQTPLR